MTATSTLDYRCIDSLIVQNRTFSIYRIPDEKTMIFALQQNGVPECFENIEDLTGKTGFVVAPFNVTADSPVILMHPDVVLEGEDRMLHFFKKEWGCLPEVPFSNTASNHPIEVETDAFPTYRRAFERFKRVLHAGTCEKIVLSRKLELPKPRRFSAGETFKAACYTYPDAFVYLCHTPQTGTWIGSSPELLLSGKADRWKTVALAGTQRTSETAAAVNWDEKNMEEQRIVTRFLEEKLSDNHLDFSTKGPNTIKAGNLLHLKTEFDFETTLKNGIGNLLQSLHPTPAVCGYPQKDAIQTIAAHEGYERTYYSGFIGVLAPENQTHLYINLRCMKIETDTLTLFAGGGVMPSSDIQSEWDETEEKLQTMRSLIMP